MPTLTFTRASHEPDKHGQPCYIVDVAKVAVVAGSVCPGHDHREHDPADELRCTVIDTGHADGCWHVQEPIEEVLAAIETEKARTLDSLAREIWALERRVASLEADRNRRDEMDAFAALTLQRMRGNPNC
jgi:hypothetical protein